MISDKLYSTENKLSVTQETRNKRYSCSFERFPPKTCECKFTRLHFVPTENFAATLYRGEKLLFTKTINTDESIKPKRPSIVSVNQTENGNFRITWDTNYTSPLRKTFSDSLSTELTYGVKGGKNDVIRLEKGRTEYEIVGRNLQPNSDYVVMARVSTDYNQNLRFSDYSQPYEFRTPVSIETVLKILIPILCVILIIFISTTFCCYNNSSFLHQSIKNDNSFPALPENLDPVIQTGLDYRPCSGPADADSTQSTPSRTEIVVVHGYQSVNEVLDHGDKPEADASVKQAFISFHSDVNLIREKPICCKKPQDVAVPACESMVISADDGYQSLPSLDQNTWSSDRSTELEKNIAQAVAQTADHNMSCVSQQERALTFKSLCGPVLNISPGIQINCSKGGVTAQNRTFAIH
ncbi:hypothetical protein AOLI_G00306780 [Acnodon oligacanthus]